MALFPGSSALRLLLLFGFLYPLFLLYGRKHFYRDPGSVFFDQSRAFERRYTDLRLGEVERTRTFFQQEYNGGRAPSVSHRSGSWPEICVSMTTVHRPGLQRQYVEDTVVSLLSGTTPEERSSMYLSLLFTDLDASVHPSWHERWLRLVVDDVWAYQSDNITVDAEKLTWLQNATQAVDNPTHIQSKASMDYTLALQRCLDQTNAPYIAVFEGDVLAAQGWAAPTLQALRHAATMMRQASESFIGKTRKTGDWIDLRLFNQERSTGWSSRRIGGNNELRIIVGLNLVLALILASFRRRDTYIHRLLDPLSLAVLCLLIIPLSIVTFFQAGKASLLPPRPGLVIENFGCCSQALIFNRNHVPRLIEYLRDFASQEIAGEVEQVGYDMRTRDFASQQELDRLALYPVQVQHMGIQSGLETTAGEAQKVWSMAFEDLSPAELRLRHQKAMSVVYGKDMDSGRSGPDNPV